MDRKHPWSCSSQTSSGPVGRSKVRKRAAFAVVSVLLIVTEIVIALYVHDSIIRPYAGDMIVVVLIYSIIRTAVPDSFRLLPVAVFLFALAVEVLQGLHIADMIAADSPLLRVALGSTFDPLDVAAYAAGCALTGAHELARAKLGRPTSDI